VRLDIHHTSLKEDGKIKDAPRAESFLDMNYLQAIETERQVAGQK
jgi:hypothetical protein